MPIRRIKPNDVHQKSTSPHSGDATAKDIGSPTHDEPAHSDAGEGSPGDDVGYRKPPKSGQFKRGQSGNPKGRPKRTKSPKSLVLGLLAERIPVKTQNGVRKMSKMEALLHKQMEKASRGDDKAFKILLNLYGEALADQMATSVAQGTEENITASDRAVLNLFLQQNAAENSAGGQNADQ